MNDAEFVEFDRASKRFDDIGLIKYSDERRYQAFMKALSKKQKEYNHIVSQNRTFDEKITIDEYFINHFIMVHFSKFIYHNHR
jgi:hypothetical protein